MGIRRKAREQALKSVFELDFYKFDSAVWSRIQNDWDKQKPEEKESQQFLERLLTTLVTHQQDVDKEIENHSSNWKLPRMASVDRNVLRLGVAEILYFEDVPKKVSINEYLEIAKRFGTEESSGFVNGILDKVNKQS